MASNKLSTPKLIHKIERELGVELYLQHSEDYCQVFLMLKFNSPADFTEVLASLADLIEDCTDNEKDHLSGGKLGHLEVH